jgi:hypothetical protein
MNTKYFQAVTIGAAWASDLTANGLVKNFFNVCCVHRVSIRDVESLNFSIFHYLVLKKSSVLGIWYSFDLYRKGNYSEHV